LHVPAAAGEDGRARLVALASMLWVRAVDGASRHGPPSFRRDVRYVGGSVRGHLDVRRTVRLRAKGASTAASVYRARELDNPVTRIIVAADRVLMRQVGQGRWRTERVDAVMAQLQTAVGRRSPAPGDRELHRMRYTPITRPFKWAAELSLRIVRQDPVATTALPGRVQGLVLDLDGIYRTAALNWARDARPELLAESLDSGKIVIRRGQEVLALVDLLPAANGSGGPAVRVCPPGRTPELLALPADAPMAAVVVRRALAAI
jgi:5-methylcytosine-specific restriction enzyme subunit McrC